MSVPLLTGGPRLLEAYPACRLIASPVLNLNSTTLPLPPIPPLRSYFLIPLALLSLNLSLFFNVFLVILLGLLAGECQRHVQPPCRYSLGKTYPWPHIPAGSRDFLRPYRLSRPSYRPPVSPLPSTYRPGATGSKPRAGAAASGAGPAAVVVGGARGDVAGVDEPLRGPPRAQSQDVPHVRSINR